MFGILAPALGTATSAQQVSAPSHSTPTVVQATLIAPGSLPFHIKAVITEGRDPDPVGHVEMYWVAPNRWRRTIEADNFSQTLVVNGDNVFERDSRDYFPLGLQTLVRAMVDPQPILDAHRPEDRLQTKANGGASESGTLMFGGRLTVRSPYGLTESVGAPGHSVDFMKYENFKGKRVARILVNSVGAGESLRATVTELEEFKNRGDELFQITEPTPKEKQIHSVVLHETDFRSLATDKLEIVWPQVLDGATTGTSAFYVSVDRSGQVREALPLHTDNERSNDSARRQIMKWKFKPVMRDGGPVQAESILTFGLNTRAWGPAAPLSDAEARKLASNITEPMVPPGTAPAGTVYTLWAAIDSEGNIIEVIPAEGPPGLFGPCYQALLKWHFNPILENGEPRPYRAEIKFRIQ